LDIHFSTVTTPATLPPAATHPVVLRQLHHQQQYLLDRPATRGNSPAVLFLSATSIASSTDGLPPVATHPVMLWRLGCAASQPPQHNTCEAPQALRIKTFQQNKRKKSCNFRKHCRMLPEQQEPS
jgi:hypothetical protein